MRSGHASKVRQGLLPVLVPVFKLCVFCFRLFFGCFFFSCAQPPTAQARLPS